MGLVSRLKKMKLKKLQPGKLIKGAVTVASALGVPGAGSAEKIVGRIGKKVESVERAANRVKAKIKQTAEEAGLGGSTVTVNGIAGPITFGDKGGDSAMPAEVAPSSGNNAMLLGLVVVAAVFLMMRGK